MFIPSTQEELQLLGWKGPLDIILISGDAYLDSPFIGVSLIGKLLLRAGYRVGIIGQPDLESDQDLTRLGEPKLFWGVTGGCVDSMVANYTALLKRRQNDDYTPGGKNTRRPDRAVIAYSNLIRKYFKNTAPIVLGGIEASLRRVAHYDYWSNSIRRSILFDAKADLLVYGMGDRTVLELAEALKKKRDYTRIPGICYKASEKRDDYLELPTFEQVKKDQSAFTEMFRTFYDHQDPIFARGLCQQQDTRYLIQNPPARYLSTTELDEVHSLDFEHELHPVHQVAGQVKALETIRFSLTSHRGCYGECNFCSIAVHQGATVRWRSQKSLEQEARKFADHPKFRGYVFDVGGPTANMYGFECGQKLKQGKCLNKRCLFPATCDKLRPNHLRQIKLLSALRNINGVKKVFVASGIRHDVVLADQKHGEEYLREIVNHHVSGQLKIAPEHTEPKVLELMGKPGQDSLLEFRTRFLKLNKVTGKKQFLTYYFIAAHPGCEEAEMVNLQRFISRELKLHPEQVQVFTPLPSTWSALMYYTGLDPFSGEKIRVERKLSAKGRQKGIITGH